MWLTAASVLFLFLSAKSNRNFPLLFIISFPVLVSFFSDYLYPGRDFMKRKFGKFVKLIYFYLLAGLLLAGLSNLNKTNFMADPFSNFCMAFPCQAVSFLKNHPEYNKLNWFNDFDYGGYLLWQLPESKLFIDGRFPQYPVNGHTILEEYNQFFDRDKAEEKLAQYRIGLVFIRRDQAPKLDWFEKYVLLVNLNQRPKYKNCLQEYLQASPDWQGVYFDKNNIIYAKKL